MSANDKFQAVSGLPSLPPAKGFDEELSLFISSLIDQNAELIRKLQELNSPSELAQIMEEVYKQAETIKSQAQEDANARAAVIIKESEAKVKLEAEKILAEAKQKAQAIIEEKTQIAIQQGLLIIQKAQQQALSIIDDVEKQAEGITGWKSPRVGFPGLQQRLRGNKAK
jgi:hypothetical protein